MIRNYYYRNDAKVDSEMNVKLAFGQPSLVHECYPDNQYDSILYLAFVKPKALSLAYSMDLSPEAVRTFQTSMLSNSKIIRRVQYFWLIFECISRLKEMWWIQLCCLPQLVRFF